MNEQAKPHTTTKADRKKHAAGHGHPRPAALTFQFLEWREEIDFSGKTSAKWYDVANFIGKFADALQKKIDIASKARGELGTWPM